MTEKVGFNEFETKLMEFGKTAQELQDAELDGQRKAQLFQQNFMAFLKEHGLPENFTLPNLALLAIRKSRA